CETNAPYFESWDTCQDCPQPPNPSCCGKFGSGFQPNIQDPICMPGSVVGQIQESNNPAAVFACEAGCNDKETCEASFGESCSTCPGDCQTSCAAPSGCLTDLNSAGGVINTAFNFSSPYDGSWTLVNPTFLGLVSDNGSSRNRTAFELPLAELSSGGQKF